MKTTCPPRRTLWPESEDCERRRGQVYPRLEHKNSDTPLGLAIIRDNCPNTADKRLVAANSLKRAIRQLQVSASAYTAAPPLTPLGLNHPRFHVLQEDSRSPTNMLTALSLILPAHRADHPIDIKRPIIACQKNDQGHSPRSKTQHPQPLFPSPHKPVSGRSAPKS